MKILIVGLKRSEVLLALYDNALFMGRAFEDQPIVKHTAMINKKQGVIGNQDKAIELIEQCAESMNFYFDAIDLGADSKPLKVNLVGSEFESSEYDSYHGEGLAEKVIKGLFAKKAAEYDNAKKLKSVSSVIRDKKSYDQNRSIIMNDPVTMQKITCYLEQHPEIDKETLLDIFITMAQVSRDPCWAKVKQSARQEPFLYLEELKPPPIRHTFYRKKQ